MATSTDTTTRRSRGRRRPYRAWLVAGGVRAATGSYTPAWYAAGALCLVAAVAALLVPRREAPVGVSRGGIDPSAP